VYGAVSLTLTLLSTFHIRYVPTVVGNLCGANGIEFCYEPLPQAGFPFAYWMDSGGVSVQGQLGFEDKISALAFGADFLVYVLLVLFIDIIIQRLQRRK
jgi:hypothetical protein